MESVHLNGNKMKIMRDFLGQKLNVGDIVIFSNTSYVRFGTAEIYKLGKSMVILDVFYQPNGNVGSENLKDQYSLED